MATTKNKFPKLHNAAWPGLVGKEEGTDHPPIGLDRMLDLTANARAGGARFDGIDLFLFDPHVSIDADDEALDELVDKVTARGLVIGSLVAPVWPPTGGGSAMGTAAERKAFLTQVEKACGIGQKLREHGARPYGIVRIDSACSVGDWRAAPDAAQRTIADTFRQAARIADDHGEQLAAEGEICWGGMHGWRHMVDLLERVDRPDVVGFQADMAHTLLYTLGYNAPDNRILPDGYDWRDQAVLDDAMQTLTDALRPWTKDLHIAQNDATVFGSGSHDKTGRHCLPDDPNGKLDVTRYAGFWLRGDDGAPTRTFQHLCWDGCMFPNEVMEDPQTWNSILATMVAVRNAHGWS
jgi:sugar phosphate isomerase/epimerase